MGGGNSVHGMGPSWPALAAGATIIKDAAWNIGKIGYQHAWTTLTGPVAKVTSLALSSYALGNYWNNVDSDELRKEIKQNEILIKDLKEQIKKLEEHTETSNNLLAAVNQQGNAILNRVDANVKDLMEKQGFTKFALQANNPEDAAMQIGFWLSDTRECYVKYYNCQQEKDACQVAQNKTAQQRDDAREALERKAEEIKTLSKIEGQFVETSKDAEKLKQCQKELKQCETSERECAIKKGQLETQLENKPRSWTSVLTFGVLG